MASSIFIMRVTENYEIKSRHPNAVLKVGVVSDEDATSYKRKPIFNEKVRSNLVSKHPAVDEVILKPPLRVDEDFIQKHGITLIFHAFANKEDSKKQDQYFDVAKRMGIFREIEYMQGVSTTQIINECKTWSDVWEKKGTVATEDLRLLNGYEQTGVEPDRLVAHMNKMLGISCTHSMWDVELD